jgi:N-acetylmuramoyl-L-alanine amidase
LKKIYALLITLCSIKANAQLPSLTLKEPLQEINTVTTPKQFITGVVCKECRVTINKVPITVYKTGVFAYQANLNSGNNVYEIVTSLNTKNIQKKIAFNYKPSKPIIATDSAIIESITIEPTGELRLTPGEIVTLRVKTIPNATLLLNDKYELKEIPKSQTKGIAGYYSLSYKLKEADSAYDNKWKISLVKNKIIKDVKVLNNNISIWDKESIIIGKTNNAHTPMYTGLGEDRLGGTKAGFLDSAIRVRLIGSIGKLYKVQLSNLLHVYINKENIDIDADNALPQSLTNNITVVGDSIHDYIKISLNNKLAYLTNAIANPQHILLNIYGATSNSNWVMQYPETLQEITDVELTQVENKVVQLRIDLKHKQLWGYKNYYEGNTLVLQIRRQKDNLNLSNFIIAVDAGHGGNNQGALGIAGKYEKEFTLLIAKEVEKILKDEGATVIMTRNADVSYDNWDRLKMLRKKMPDMAISIHLNSAGDPLRVKGVSTYYKYNAMKGLSSTIYKNVIQTGLHGWGNIGNFNFYLNSATEFPTALVETLFVSNPEDEEKVHDPLFRKQFAQKVVEGIKEWLRNVAEGK